MLEPCDAKVSRTVLRGLGDRKVAWLLGKRPLGLYRWDLEYLVESLSMVLDGRYYGELPPKRRPTVQRLHDRIRAEYDSAYGQDRDISG